MEKSKNWIDELDGELLLDVVGVGIGGILPAGVFLGVGTALGIIPSVTKDLFLYTFLFFVVTVIPLLWKARFKGDKGGGWMMFAAMLSILYLNIFVYATGGPTISLFAFHYLYIPVVVGLSLGTKELKQAAWACGITYWINLIATNANVSWLTWNPPLLSAMAKIGQQWSYLVAFGLVFLVQLWMTYLIATRTTIRPPVKTPA